MRWLERVLAVLVFSGGDVDLIASLREMPAISFFFLAQNQNLVARPLRRLEKLLAVLVFNGGGYGIFEILVTSIYG